MHTLGEGHMHLSFSHCYTALPISYLLSCTGHTSCFQLPWEMGQAVLGTWFYPYYSVRNLEAQRDDMTGKADP